MKSASKAFFFYLLFFVATAQAYETTLQSYYIVYQGKSGSFKFGQFDRVFKEREYLGGPFGTYRWPIQQLHIKNCTDIKVLEARPMQVENQKVVSAMPVSCNFSVREHNFKSNPTIGYLIDHPLLGEFANDSSKVKFWIFRPGWRTQFTLPVSPRTGSGAQVIEIFFQ